MSRPFEIKLLLTVCQTTKSCLVVQDQVWMSPHIAGYTNLCMRLCVLCVYTGTTREDEADGRKVVGLEYEAYEPMAQSEFNKLCADIRARWQSVTHICVHHRLG